MKKYIRLFIISFIGISFSATPFFADENILAVEVNDKKSSILEGIKICLKICEDFVLSLIHKEITHILRHLPCWLERLSKIKVKSCPQESDYIHLFSLVTLLQEYKKKTPLLLSTPLFNELDFYGDVESRDKHLLFIMNSPKDALDFLQEVMLVLQSFLENKSMVGVDRSIITTTLFFKQLYL